MTTTTLATPIPDPEWLLRSLSDFLTSDYREAAAEYAAGNRNLTDKDLLRGIARGLMYLASVTGGQFGLSPEQLRAIVDEAEAGR